MAWWVDKFDPLKFFSLPDQPCLTHQLRRVGPVGQRLSVFFFFFRHLDQAQYDIQGFSISPPTPKTISAPPSLLKQPISLSTPHLSQLSLLQQCFPHSSWWLFPVTSIRSRTRTTAAAGHERQRWHQDMNGGDGSKTRTVAAAATAAGHSQQQQEQDMTVERSKAETDGDRRDDGLQAPDRWSPSFLYSAIQIHIFFYLTIIFLKKKI